MSPSTYLLGEDLTVLDLYVAVISRFGPWRDRFYAKALRLTALWARRFP